MSVDAEYEHAPGVHPAPVQSTSTRTRYIAGPPPGNGGRMASHPRPSAVMTALQMPFGAADTGPADTDAPAPPAASVPSTATARRRRTRRMVS